MMGNGRSDGSSGSPRIVLDEQNPGGGTGPTSGGFNYEDATSQHQRITKEIEEAGKVLYKARNDGKRRRYRRKIKRLQKEDEKFKARIDEAKHMLNNVLLEEAKMASADPSWLRP